MDKKEIIEKASKKVSVGEMETQKISKSNWISLVVAAVFVAGFCIAEGALGHPTGVYAILAIVSTWASVFYTLQYFIAKRPRGVLIGSVLCGLAAIGLITCYVLANVYNW